MNDIEILNQHLNSKFKSFKEVYNLEEALSVCLNDERLYRYISLFNESTWTDINQEIFAKVLNNYKKNNRFLPNIKKVTNALLLTRAYELNIGVIYRAATIQALDEENIKLALDRNEYSAFIFRESPLVLKVYLENNLDYNIGFEDYTWTEENAKIYLNNLVNGKIKRKIYSFYNNVENFKVVIKEHEFQILNDFYLSSDKLNNEIGNLLYEKMIEAPNLITKLQMFKIQNIATYYLKALIIAKRFDLVSDAINNKSINQENIQLLADNLETYLNNNNGEISYYLIIYPNILKKVILLKKYELINKFYDQNVWTEDNIKLLYDANLNNEFYRRFEHNSNALKIYILGNYNIDINFSNQNDLIVWTDENIELYFLYLKTNKPDKIIRSFIDIPNFFNRCLHHDVFKYLNLSYDKDIDNDLLCKKLREFPNEEFNLPNTLLINNKQLALTLIDTKRFAMYDDPLFPYDLEIGQKFAENLEEYFSNGFDNIPYKFNTSTEILKKVIQLGRFDKLSTFCYAWNIENISLIANCYVNDKLSFLNITCRSEPYLVYALKNLNVYLPHATIFTVNHYDYSQYQDPFFKYLQEKKIGDIYDLITYYKQKNILKDYIKAGYITDKFRKVLIFNHGYQQYCQENNIDITANIDDLSLLSYLKCAYKVPNLYNGIFINETNYQQYFDQYGPKNELYEFLFNHNSLATFKSLIDIYPNEKIEPIKIYATNKFLSIENIYIIKLCFKYFLDHYSLMNIQKVDDLVNIVYRLEYSNSIEMREFREQILANVLDNDNPYEILNRIENIFLKDNVPMFAKIFMCFKILYPNFQKKNRDNRDIFDFSENSRISPNLLLADPKNERMQAYKKIVNGDKNLIRFQIIFNILLKCAINSNNQSLVKYLNLLKIGNEFIIKLQNNNYDINILNDNELKILDDFINKLSIIYENNSNKTLTMNLIEKCKYLTDYYKPNGKYSLADRIVRSFGYFAGIDSLEQIFKMMKDVKIKSQKENEQLIKYLQNNLFKLKDNDLIRCIGTFNVLDGSLENGNFCKELLGPIIGKSESDTTPLDVDFTLVKAQDNIYNCIDGTPTGWGFGNIFIVLKNNYVITRDQNGNLLDTVYDPMKVDVFCTKTKNGGYETHYAATGGIDKNDILCVIYKKLAAIDPNKPYKEDGSVNYIGNSVFDDLPSIKFIMAKNQLNVPIVDLSGKELFYSNNNYNEYEYIRSKMMGLSHYGCTKYEIDKESLYFDGIEELVNEILEDQQRIEKIRKTICKRIEEIITNPNNDLDIKRIDKVFNGDLSDGICELFETGSTSRFSNVPRDSDFDFMLKIDRKYIMNNDTVKKIIEMFKSELKPKGIIPTKSNRFRGTGITILNFENLDIDISLDQRTNNDIYTSEMCLEDRYKSIKEQYPEYYPYVLTNVVKAKKLLKNVAYKREEGGMGGIGIENWILQNGGSLKKAAEDFVNHAYNKDGSLKKFDEFKQIYYVFDFGCNHEPREKLHNVLFPYDNYIADNLNETSYKNIASTLKEYLNNLTYNNSQNIHK